MLVKVFCWIIQ